MAASYYYGEARQSRRQKMAAPGQSVLPVWGRSHGHGSGALTTRLTTTRVYVQPRLAYPADHDKCAAKSPMPPLLALVLSQVIGSDSIEMPTGPIIRRSWVRSPPAPLVLRRADLALAVAAAVIYILLALARPAMRVNPAEVGRL